MKRTILVFYLLTLLLALPAPAQFLSPCFTMSTSDYQDVVCVGATVAGADSIITLPNSRQISGLFISGHASLQDKYDCHIRITLQDTQGFEYLVYEVYPYLSDLLNVQFSKVGLESSVLNRIVPQSIKIETIRSSVTIDSVYFTYNNYPPNRILQLSETNREEFAKMARQVKVFNFFFSKYGYRFVCWAMRYPKMIKWVFDAKMKRETFLEK